MRLNLSPPPPGPDSGWRTTGSIIVNDCLYEALFTPWLQDTVSLHHTAHAYIKIFLVVNWAVCQYTRTTSVYQPTPGGIHVFTSSGASGTSLTEDYPICSVNIQLFLFSRMSKTLSQPALGRTGVNVAHHQNLQKLDTSSCRSSASCLSEQLLSVAAELSLSGRSEQQPGRSCRPTRETDTSVLLLSDIISDSAASLIKSHGWVLVWDQICDWWKT